MGRSKAALPWHGPTLLERVTGILARSLDGPIVVVRASGQELPRLWASVEVVEDACEGRGPLEGIAAGLRAVEGRAWAAYVSSTDVPLLHPAFVRRVVEALDGEADAAVPRAGGCVHPLAAAYKTSLLPLVEELLAAERLPTLALLDEARVRWLDEDDLLADPELATVDAGLDSLRNLNELADYEAARALPEPEVLVACLGTPGAPGQDGPIPVRASTLRAAAAAAGVELDPTVVAHVNGEIARDRTLPLVGGDVVTFTSTVSGESADRY